MTYKLPLLTQDVLLEARRWIFSHHNWAHSRFGCRVMAYLNQYYQNRWIGRHGPMPWSPRSPDLTLPDSFLWRVMKEMTYRAKVHTKRNFCIGLWMAASIIRYRSSALLTYENISNRFILSFNFPCTHIETATASRRLQLGPILY
jgi:hypothetical protein